jgi:hypothetical protein
MRFSRMDQRLLSASIGHEFRKISFSEPDVASNLGIIS